MDELLFKAAQLNQDQQHDFLQRLSGVLTAEELQAVAVGIGYFRLLLFPELKQAMQQEMAAELLKEFKEV